MNSKSFIKISVNLIRIRTAPSNPKSSLIFLVSIKVSLFIFIWCTELANNPLVKRVIAVLDKNKDGSISFFEFVHGLNALTASGSSVEKLKFAFSIYDINDDGYISNGELFTVLKMMVGSNLTDIQL